MALAFQDANEGQLELAVVAGVDDGVEAAVEVAQPEDDFEEHIRRPQVDVERAWEHEGRVETLNSGMRCCKILIFKYWLQDAAGIKMLLLASAPPSRIINQL